MERLPHVCTPQFAYILLCALTALFTGMAPKGSAKKLRGRANQAKGAHTLATRSEDTKRGLRLARIAIDPAKLQRCWLKLRSAFMVCLLHQIAIKRRKERQLLNALRDVKDRLPSLYKAKQFAASGHHAFNSADERRLVRARNDFAEAKEETKTCRKEVRLVEAQLIKEQRANGSLQEKLAAANEKSKEVTRQSRPEYKKQWMREQRRQYVASTILPELRKSAASLTLTEDQRLQLVVDHITQVCLITALLTHPYGWLIVLHT